MYIFHDNIIRVMEKYMEGQLTMQTIGLNNCAKK